MPRNLQRNELLAHAQRTLDSMPGASVHFKYTCAACGERVIFETPNVLHETGTCCHCGHTQKVTEGGYTLDIPLG